MHQYHLPNQVFQGVQEALVVPSCQLAESVQEARGQVLELEVVEEVQDLVVEQLQD